ncbi:hypothetical protein [Streptomyces sp. NPDC004629]|uniref:hypothetical protein n=1 Tax=Streptomyces sp. NPDC004629 TaxID=3364705 RepID=UPI0036BF51AB
MEPAAAVAAAAKNADGITSFRYRLTGSVPGEGKIKGEAAMSVKPLAMSMKMAVRGQGHRRTGRDDEGRRAGLSPRGSRRRDGFA